MNTLDDLVSIIIPIYNSEKFLKDSINSALNQTHKNIEIIAVDDGSTDNSLDILEQYSNKITIVSQPNSGLSTALNAGIKKINGKWIKWFSPDDILYPNAIETLLKEAKKLPENTIVYSNWEIIDEKGMKIRDFHESDYNDLEIFDFNVRLLAGQQINVNTTLIPFSLFERGCFIQDLKDPVAVDYDFFLRAGIFYNMNFYLVKKNLLKYRIHSSQLSHRNIVKSLSYLDIIREDILSKLDEITSNTYHVSLKKYSKEKKIEKRTMELGLKIISKLLPSDVSDRILVFYLNKIRRGR